MLHSKQTACPSELSEVHSNSGLTSSIVFYFAGGIFLFIAASFFMGRLLEDSIHDKLLAAAALSGISGYALLAYKFPSKLFFLWIFLLPLTGQIAFQLGLTSFSICQLLLNSLMAGMLFRYARVSPGSRQFQFFNKRANLKMRHYKYKISTLAGYWDNFLSKACLLVEP